MPYSVLQKEKPLRAGIALLVSLLLCLSNAIFCQSVMAKAEPENNAGSFRFTPLSSNGQGSATGQARVENKVANLFASEMATVLMDNQKVELNEGAEAGGKKVAQGICLRSALQKIGKEIYLRNLCILRKIGQEKGADCIILKNGKTVRDKIVSCANHELALSSGTKVAEKEVLSVLSEDLYTLDWKINPASKDERFFSSFARSTKSETAHNVMPAIRTALSQEKLSWTNGIWIPDATEAPALAENQKTPVNFSVGPGFLSKCIVMTYFWWKFRHLREPKPPKPPGPILRMPVVKQFNGIPPTPPDPKDPSPEPQNLVVTPQLVFRCLLLAYVWWRFDFDEEEKDKNSQVTTGDGEKKSKLSSSTAELDFQIMRDPATGQSAIVACPLTYSGESEPKTQPVSYSDNAVRAPIFAPVNARKIKRGNNPPANKGQDDDLIAKIKQWIEEEEEKRKKQLDPDGGAETPPKPKPPLKDVFWPVKGKVEPPKKKDPKTPDDPKPPEKTDEKIPDDSKSPKKNDEKTPEDPIPESDGEDGLDDDSIKKLVEDILNELRKKRDIKTPPPPKPNPPIVKEEPVKNKVPIPPVPPKSPKDPVPQDDNSEKSDLNQISSEVINELKKRKIKRRRRRVKIEIPPPLPPGPKKPGLETRLPENPVVVRIAKFQLVENKSSSQDSSGLKNDTSGSEEKPTEEMRNYLERIRKLTVPSKRLSEFRLVNEQDTEPEDSDNSDTLDGGMGPDDPVTVDSKTETSIAACLELFKEIASSGVTPLIVGETADFDGEQLAVHLPGSLEMIEEQKEVVDLEDASIKGLCSYKLIGDGVDTLQFQLEIKNLTDKVIKLNKRAFMFFNPSKAEFQTMLNTDDPPIVIEQGQSVTLLVPSVCVSTKTIKPPPASGVEYKIGTHPDKDAAPNLIALVKTSRKLESEGKFSDLAIKPEKRAQKIAQTSIWKYLGDKSKNKADRISVQTLLDDLSKGLDLKSLSSEQKKKLEDFAQKIYKAAELNLKETGLQGYQ